MERRKHSWNKTLVQMKGRGTPLAPFSSSLSRYVVRVFPARRPTASAAVHFSNLLILPSYISRPLSRRRAERSSGHTYLVCKYIFSSRNRQGNISILRNESLSQSRVRKQREANSCWPFQAGAKMKGVINLGVHEL